ncbi:something about silencing protein 10 [Tribolium madens]|uniref:something about silencing protein 10 n=1 Tax=Tribolium madens TaxID=41895 RepID=UPI001CF74CA2|nr:something about silencing protein 10 [Tribolium madens]
MSSHLRFNEDESDYNPSDSDEDYTENEKILLKKVRNKLPKDSDSEGEVFGVGSGTDDEEDDQSDIALSDVEGQEDQDDLPDIRAWGKEKRKFYSTDYVDPDYGGFQGKDAHLAELEEEEARNLQKQLAEQLDDDDFCLDVPAKKVTEEDKQVSEELIKSDISKLSKRQKLQILQKESPEFFGLVEDFEEKMIVARDFLKPVLVQYKKGQISNCSAMEFVETHHELILNYCVNINMYLLLKASRVNMQNHPVIKRLYQYRQLLSQMTPVFEEVIKPQIELLLNEEDREVPKKTLKVLSKLVNKTEKKDNKKKPAGSKKVQFNPDVDEKEAPNNEQEMDEEANVPENDSGKRAITYQIAKNKGLTPHRKKEQRNPRVKHRNKFRKAKIRRRGAVREPRTEMTRYGGEFSGIKASVSKSIKIKT